MSIQSKINEDLKAAMLAKNEALKSFLRVIIGEFNRIDKVVPDDKAISKLKSLLENAVLLKNQFEIDVLSTYLPQQLSESEIKDIINDLIFEKEYSSIKDMGKIMSDFKTQFAGKYDGKLVSELIKERFK